VVWVDGRLYGDTQSGHAVLLLLEHIFKTHLCVCPALKGVDMMVVCC
jgi:hypothetical protein